MHCIMTTLFILIVVAILGLIVLCGYGIFFLIAAISGAIRWSGMTPEERVAEYHKIHDESLRNQELKCQSSKQMPEGDWENNDATTLSAM